MTDQSSPDPQQPQPSPWSNAPVHWQPVAAPPPQRPPSARSGSGTIAGLAMLVVLVFVAGLLIGESGVLGLGPAHVGQPSPGQVITPAPGETPSVPLPSPPPGAPVDFALFWEAYDIIRQNFVGRGELGELQLTYGAIRGLVDALGDTGHSVFLTPEALRREQEALEGRIVGIGVLLGERDGRPMIVSVVSGGPASRAGLRSGDELVEVDGEDITRLAPEEIAPRVRGDAGTTVRLRVIRPSTNERLDFEIVREEIRFPAANWAMVPGTTIAHLRLIQFSQDSADELRAARDEALAQGATAFIFDLRSNPGGLVHEAIRVASMFLEGRTVYIRELADGSRIEVPTCGPAGTPNRSEFCRPVDTAATPEVPMVVLIDEGTASSAEIVSGAIRSAGRAELVGTTTFGTGTVLLTYELSDGSAIRIAIERWLTPDGELIFDHGIVPTIELELDPAARPFEPEDLQHVPPGGLLEIEDTQLLRAVELLGGPR